ncbi:MAG TPA: thaumatin family protein [Polyangiaceae bacterium]|nr:thaumatin family protein [Polyangiaceae bacterium]
MSLSTAPWRLWHGWIALVALTVSCGSSDAPSKNAAGGTANDNAGGSGNATSANGGSRNATSVGGTNAGGSKANTAGRSAVTDTPDCAHDADGRTTLVFVNGCSAAVTFRGSDIEGGELAPGAARCVDIGSDVDALSAKRYWGFRGEDPGAEHHSLAEFTFNTDFNDFDWYNISYVDAFNLPLQIIPLVRPKCKALSCPADLLPECPSVGRFEDSKGNLVACVSPDRNNAMSAVALYFESCDDTYAWSGDDQKGDDPSPVRACAGEDFEITFCPGAP